jgi:glucokinase
VTTSDPQRAVIGIDVGGTKLAAGLVDVTTGGVRGHLRVPTAKERGPAAILADCVGLAERLAAVDPVAAIGLGLCEFVDRAGRPDSAQTIDWRDVDVPAAFAHIAPLVVESDVRAAAIAEVRFGAGAGIREVLYVTVGTGISCALLVDGVPYAGAHGHAISLGAPVVEDVAAGPALAAAGGRARAEDVVDDPALAGVVDAAAAALGREIAALVNALDPAIVIVGGGLGLNDAYRERVARAARPFLFSERVATVPIVPARLGTDAGIVGAALAAVAERSRCDGRSIR